MDKAVFDNSPTFKELQLDQNKWIHHNSKYRLRYLKEKNSGAKDRLAAKFHRDKYVE